MRPSRPSDGGPGGEPAPAQRTNLSPRATSLVGRQGELESLGRLCAGGGRLITVLGTAGVGKTRLVQEYGLRRAAAAEPTSGAWFCDLTDVTDAAGVVAAAGRALSVSLTAGSVAGASEELGRALAARGSILVILDNFEQAVAAGPETVGRWLALAPEARFLVTSRQRLNLEGEVVFDLEPLGLPADGAAASESDAVRLFLDRSSALRGSDGLPAREVAAVAELVRRLDGLPLVIELAAARTRSMSPSQILARLDRQLDMLATRRRDAPARRGTLRQALDDSWRLLSPWEQAAAAQASVFRVGFDLEAAEAVLDLAGFATAPPVAEVLEALCDKSILRAEISTPAAGLRFHLYESVRAYCSERLAETDGEALVAERHADHYLARGAALAEAIGGEEGPPALARLFDDIANVQAVHRRAVSSETTTSLSARRALEASLALAPALGARGPLAALLALLDGALDRAATVDSDPRLRCRAHLERGLIHRLSNLSAAEADFNRALALARELGDVALKGLAHTRVGGLRFLQNRLDDAEESASRALELFRPAGDRHGEAQALLLACIVTQYQGRLYDALARCREALHCAEGSKDRRIEAKIRSSAGRLELVLGDRDAARHHLQIALDIMRDWGDLLHQGYLLCYFGVLHHLDGDFGDAGASYDRGIELLDQAGGVHPGAVYRSYRALLAHEQGHAEEALAQLSTGLETLRGFGERERVAWLLGCRASVLADVQRHDAAARALAEAEALLAERPHVVLTDALKLQRAHLDLAEARRAAGAGDADGAQRLEAAVRKRLEAASAPGAAAGAEVLVAARGLSRALGGRSTRVPALRVGPGGAWFEPPGGDRVDLSRRRALPRLLWCLAEAHARARETPVGVEELVTAGWPGDKILPEAALNRLHVALTTLRKLGLRDCLVRDERGWHLAPSLAVVREGD